MMRCNGWVALGALFSGFLVASSARCDESRVRSSTTGVSQPSPLRFEPPRAPLRRVARASSGFRLPTFLSFGSPSTSVLAPRVASAPRAVECRQHCTGSNVAVDPPRASASLVLAGVGALGVLTGVVLTITQPKRHERASVAPALRLKLSGQRAFASADWRF
jgi:hypothetical protein